LQAVPAQVARVIDGDEAQAVAVAAGVAYVGTSAGKVVAVDMLSGAVLGEVEAGPSVQDLAIEGDTLFVLTGLGAAEAELRSFSLLQYGFEPQAPSEGSQAKGIH
jgi:outer membrane protein assembly factor BamB